MWELFYREGADWVKVCASDTVRDKHIRKYARKHQLNDLKGKKAYNLYKITNKDGYDYAIGMARNHGKTGRFKFEWTMVKPTRTVWQCIARGCPGCRVCKEEIK